MSSTRRTWSWCGFAWVLTFAVLIAGTARAQAPTPTPACLPELRRALPPGGVPDHVVAVELLATALRLAEPAFPAMRGGAPQIADDDPGYGAATYLYRRYLLPAEWSPERFDDDAWRRMLQAFVDAYRAPMPETIIGGGRVGMIQDVAATLQNVSDALRPLAVFATGPGDEVTFFAVVWNWTIAPRLIIMRPDEGLRLGDGRTSSERAQHVLEEMNTCAWRFRSFVYADESVALPLFVQQGRSIMRILASEPPRDGWPVVIDADEVVPAFRFDHEVLDGVQAIAVSIEGPSIGVGTAVAVLAQVRTNLGVNDLFHYLAIP
jgi:hypothetical protein